MLSADCAQDAVRAATVADASRDSNGMDKSSAHEASCDGEPNLPQAGVPAKRGSENDLK